MNKLFIYAETQKNYLKNEFALSVNTMNTVNFNYCKTDLE